ncbi:MAG: MarR family winged helix-turn-helix transcriptional regulator [Candidatus Izemoplasmatales bacterium]|jgi:DNA-binding MarR family transcriptional regulator|nr:MarR family winged helix-turn-helix transcriptional regulator [Candidatus Izemoplasmatales bacterium]
MSDTRHLINELLVDIFNRILTIEGEALKQRGVKLSMSEVHVLEAIQKLPDPSMTSIAQRLGITAGSLSVAINTLYQKGYVRRYYDQFDRRKVLIALEDKAVNALTIHDAFHEQMIAEIFKDLKIEEDEVLVQSLRRVSDYFKNYPIIE